MYALARGATALLLLQAAAHQGATPWAGEHPSYAQTTGLFWDAGWYHRIADEGYPGELPVDAGGYVQQSAWAFFPLYPMLVRGLMAFTTLSWEVVAPTTSLLLGAGAVILPGMAIGSNAVIAAGAVVREAVADHCLVAGNPARMIRTEYAGYRNLSV